MAAATMAVEVQSSSLSGLRALENLFRQGKDGSKTKQTCGKRTVVKKEKEDGEDEKKKDTQKKDAGGGRRESTDVE